MDDTLYRAGEWVTAGAPVVSLLEPGAVKLRFFVPEPRLAQVVPGARVQVSCDGCGAGLAATGAKLLRASATLASSDGILDGGELCDGDEFHGRASTTRLHCCLGRICWAPIHAKVTADA